jgi:hypothetical protein
MLLAGKAACAGLTFLLLTIGISGPRPTPLASRSSLSKGVPGWAHPHDVIKMQQTLQDKGHYETTQGKPSAGIKSAIASGRTRKTLRRADKTVAAPESGPGRPREKTSS